MGHVRLGLLTPSHIEQVISAARKSGASPSTVRMVHVVMRQMLDTAVRDGLVRRNVAASIERPRVPRTDAVYLAPEQVRALLEAASGDRLEALWTLLALTGMRRGEALALRWTDLDLSGSTAKFHRTLARVGGRLTFDEVKSSRSRRVVPLADPVVAALREHRRRQVAEQLAAPGWNDEQGLVFVSRIGTPLEPHNAWRSFKTLARAAGVPDAKIHTLRHSAATAALAAGIPMKIVSDLLGHASLSITADTYSHVTADLAHAAAADLAHAVLGP